MTQTIIPQEKPKKNFDFIDSIRGIAMLGIVLEHSSAFWLLKYESYNDKLIQAGYMTVFKFATITFFLISGFLINHKFTEYTPIQYLKNRFKNTIGPWLFWIFIYLTLLIGHQVFITLKTTAPHISPINWYDSTVGMFFLVIFHSNYWFILNFLICIAILLLFKKYIYKWEFGFILALFSLFYSVNLYYGWLPLEHTTALFGFVFYLWLGIILNKHFDRVKAILGNISFGTIIIVNIVLFALATLESVHLMDLNLKDPFNTLRITNIIYSFGIFALLLKIKDMKNVQKILNPRHTTFGIYLLHLIIIDHLLIEVLRPLKLDVNTMSAFGVVGYSIIRFVITYVITLLLVKLIARTKFKWSIGSR
ncbi:acyltransferase [Pedobacter frigiditerrae]|uniref:acyltransferase n=1 Tax=Pedobacter frigiditerrae TaxID=2530452 RepID=UPI00292F62C5|nr:acyltransferase [Pedobacter frigiditerrae]